MRLSVDKRKRSRKKKTRLQKLWQRAERLQNENDRLNRDLEHLLDRVRHEVVPAQIELGRTARDLILHLLPFLHRRSLAEWQRAEIRHWVEEELELVVPLGLMDDALKQALSRDSALQMGLTIDEASDISPHEQVEAALEEKEGAAEEWFESGFQALIDEEVEKRVRRKFGSKRRRGSGEDLFQAELEEAERTRAEEIERFRQQTKEDLRVQFEAEVEGLFGDAFDASFDDESGDSDGNGSRATAIDNGLVNRLFRRTANALHPDKEQDDDRRREKHALMGALLEARKKGDILTIFRLHREYVGADPDLDTRNEGQLLDALAQQVENLENEKGEIIDQSPAHASAYDQFYARTRKGVDRNIAEYIGRSEQYAASLREVIHEVKTLKALKPLLEQRRQERYFSLIDVVAFDESF